MNTAKKKSVISLIDELHVFDYRMQEFLNSLVIQKTIIQEHSAKNSDELKKIFEDEKNTKNILVARKLTYAKEILIVIRSLREVVPESGSRLNEIEKLWDRIPKHHGEANEPLPDVPTSFSVRTESVQKALEELQNIVSRLREDVNREPEA